MIPHELNEHVEELSEVNEPLSLYELKETA